MDYIPSFMLKKIYEAGSLKNVEGGFQFALKNNIGSGTLVGLAKVEVDGVAVEPENIMAGRGEATAKASEMSYQKPVYFNVGDTFVVKVLGQTLAPGEHNITLTVNTSEIGQVSIPISDTIQ